MTDDIAPGDPRLVGYAPEDGVVRPPPAPAALSEQEVRRMSLLRLLAPRSRRRRYHGSGATCFVG